MNRMHACGDAGDSVSGDLSKVQFARIIDGNLIYDERKDDDFVFEGTIAM